MGQIVAEQTTIEHGREVITEIRKSVQSDENQVLPNSLPGVLAKREMVPHVTPLLVSGREIQQKECHVALEVQCAGGTCKGIWRPGGAIEWTSHPFSDTTLQAMGTDLSSLLPSEWEIPKGLPGRLVTQRHSSR